MIKGDKMQKIDYSMLDEFKNFINANGIILKEKDVITFITKNDVNINVIDDAIVGVKIIDEHQNCKIIGKVSE